MMRLSGSPSAGQNPVASQVDRLREAFASEQEQMTTAAGGSSSERC